MLSPLLLNLLLLFIIFLISSYVVVVVADRTQLLIVNNCNDSIWPGILGNTGHETPYNGGFHLPVGHHRILHLPERWSGRIWARQGCCFDSKGKGSCQTGDCGGRLQCGGTGGIPPATLVEMTLGTPTNAEHYYDVSLVDGFNLPVSMIPASSGGGDRGCGVAACEADVNAQCPENMAVSREGKVVGCKSGCLATRDPRICCTGEFAERGSCKPSSFSRLFKVACPRAYSYPYDESTGLKSCRAKRYVVTFCPPN